MRWLEVLRLSVWGLAVRRRYIAVVRFFTSGRESREIEIIFIVTGPPETKAEPLRGGEELTMSKTVDVSQ